MNEQEQLGGVPRNHRSLSMCHINIQSLIGAGKQGPTTDANTKLDQVRTILQLQHNFDIICMSETWLSNTVPDENIELEGYDVYCRDRQLRGGGVCLYIDTAITCNRRHDLETTELELM